MGAGFLFGSAGFALSVAFSGKDFLTNFFAPRQMSISLAWKAFYNLSPTVLVMSAVGYTLTVMAGDDRTGRILKCYIILAGITGLLFSVGEGTGANAFFELILASVMAVAYGLTKMEGDVVTARQVPSIIMVSLLAVLCGPAVSTAKDTLNFRAWWAAQLSRQGETLKVVEYLSKRPGEAICTVPSYCVWAGKGMGVLAPFGYRESVLAGLVSEQKVEGAIAKHAYEAIVLQTAFDTELTDNFVDTVRRYYVPADLPRDWVTVYVPRPD